MNKITTALSGLILVTAATTANAYIIGDNYVGADDKGAGDVIGNPAKYDIFDMNVSMLAGNILSVSINTNFTAYNGTNPSQTQDNLGIRFGDLFLSSAWTPYGTPNYVLDDASNGTVWTHGFSLDNGLAQSGAGTLFTLNAGNNAANALLSDDVMDVGSSFRAGQEVAVDLASDITAVGAGTWGVAGSNLNFLIDLTGTSLEGSKSIALHWTMSCANDVIEGEYNVPEPALLGLLAMGLIGIGVSKRKKV